MIDLPRLWTHPWHNHAHHRPEGGFQNVWPEPEDFSGGSFWKGASWFFGSHLLQRKVNRPAPRIELSASDLMAPSAGVRLTWMGHSTVLLQRPDICILIDPMFGLRASPLRFAGPRRHVLPPIQIRDLPPLDLVLLSHNHYDHMDEGTIRQIMALHDPVFLVPLGCAGYLEAWGARSVIEADWWQYADFGPLRIHCTPAKHFSGRGLRDRDASLWCGWYLEPARGGSERPRQGVEQSRQGIEQSHHGQARSPLRPEQTPDTPERSAIYYSGDTAYADHFRTVRERIGAPAVAILPIGAYRPRWLMGPVHVTPEEAVQAFLDLEAKHFVPVHWGTFDLAEEPIQEPPEALRRTAAERGIAERVHVLKVGESLPFSLV